MTRTLATAAAEAADCTKCRLAEGRTQVVFGVGNADADVMFIGEAPGFHEDKQGEPFVGAAGQLLTRMLDEVLGFARGDVYIANVIKCRPPGNRDPQEDEIDSCTPWLVEQVSLIQPRVIVTLGNFATKFILQSQIGITRARGQRYMVRGSVVVPTFHPAAALRGSKFGGVSPIDAIREDLQVVKSALDEAHVEEQRSAEARTAEKEDSGLDITDSDTQLGLF